MVGTASVEPVLGVQTSAPLTGGWGTDVGGGPAAADGLATADGPAAADELTVAVEPAASGAFREVASHGAGVGDSAGWEPVPGEVAAAAGRSGPGTSSFLSASSGVFIGRVTSVPSRADDPAARAAAPAPRAPPEPPAGFAFVATASPALLRLLCPFAWSPLPAAVVSDFSAPATGAAWLASSATCASGSTRLFTRPSFLPTS